MQLLTFCLREPNTSKNVWNLWEGTMSCSLLVSMGRNFSAKWLQILVCSWLCENGRGNKAKVGQLMTFWNGQCSTGFLILNTTEQSRNVNLNRFHQFEEKIARYSYELVSHPLGRRARVLTTRRSR